MFKMFSAKNSIRARVISHINEKIDRAQEILEEEVRALHARHLAEVEESENRFKTESEACADKHVNSIIKGIM